VQRAQKLISGRRYLAAATIGQSDCMAAELRGPVDGTVVSFNPEEGWGVLASKDVEGEVWVHFSSIQVSGYQTLRVGQPVRFTYRTYDQDGYPHGAESVETL
jgi:CspA family cold shock protein